MTAKKEHLGYLDGWRGLAIGMVLIAHFAPPTGFDLGRFGVDLFFVLSGFLMSRILFEQRVPIGTFYRRRIARVFPALSLFLLVVIPLFDVLGYRTSATEVLGLATFTRTYMASPTIWLSAAPVQHMWSLAVEEHCYVLLSVVAVVAALRVRSAAVLMGLAALTFVAIGWHRLVDPSIDQPYLLNTECAATCLLMSAGYRRIAPRLPIPGWVAVAALLLTPLCYLTSLHWTVRVVVPPFLLAFAVNHIGSAAPVVLRALSAAWLRYLGVVSYSIYLWQQPFHQFRADFPPGTAVVLACIVGTASYYVLESPVRQWLNEHWRGRQTAFAQAEGTTG